jgi:hypothetical protein
MSSFLIDKFLKNVIDDCQIKKAQKQQKYEKESIKVILITIFELKIQLSLINYFRKKNIIGIDTY